MSDTSQPYWGEGTFGTELFGLSVQPSFSGPYIVNPALVVWDLRDDITANWDLSSPVSGIWDVENEANLLVSFDEI